MDVPHGQSPPTNENAGGGTPALETHQYNLSADSTPKRVAVKTAEGIDNITVLHAGKHLVKTWSVNGNIKAYDDAKNYRVEVTPVAGIEQLSALLSNLESDSKSCIVRGAFVGFEEARRRESLEHSDKTFRRNSLFDDQLLHTLLVEVDAFEPLAFDPFTHPIEAVEEYIATCLPIEFHGVSFHWQLSNSAGHPDKRHLLKVHLWFWLSKPYTSAQLKAWAGAIELKADHSVFQKIQIHYTGAPRFEEGAIDPIVVRSEFVSGSAGDEVHLDIGHEIPAKVEREKITRSEKLRGAIHSDPIAQFLTDQGLVKSQRSDGGLNIHCPFEGEHTTDSGDTATTYFLAHTGGFASGAFKCMHAHCEDRTQGAFHSAIGYIANDFVASTDDEPNKSPDKRSVRFKRIPAAEFAKLSTGEWIVKNVFPQAEIGVLFGESGSGKSFFTLDIVAAIDRGIPWRGLRVRKGRIVYIAAEGAQGFRNRLKAYSQHHGVSLESMTIDVIPEVPNLLSRTDREALIEDIQAGGPVDFIVVDTLAQTTPGGNENSGEDVGTAISTCKALHRATGAFVLLIHHSGKDASKGARGWSGLRAAADVEIEITRNGDDRCARVTKQKDGEDGLEFAFKLISVVVGRDEDGDAITSCAVKHLHKRQPQSLAMPTGKWESIVWGALLDAVKLDGAGPSEADLVAEVLFREKYDPGPDAENPKEDRRKDLIREAIKKLVNKGYMVKTDGAYLPSDPVESQ